MCQDRPRFLNQSLWLSRYFLGRNFITQSCTSSPEDWSMYQGRPGGPCPGSYFVIGAPSNKQNSTGPLRVPTMLISCTKIQLCTITSSKHSGLSLQFSIECTRWAVSRPWTYINNSFNLPIKEEMIRFFSSKNFVEAAP